MSQGRGCPAARDLWKPAQGEPRIMHRRILPGTAGPHASDAIRRPRILLAEDCTASRLLTAALLRGLGCDIAAVGDGGGAVQRASWSRYDLILLDIDMPVIDGIRAARIIRCR